MSTTNTIEKPVVTTVNPAITTGAVSTTGKAADLVFTATKTALEQIMFRREAWESGLYKTATTELYKLLADCYAFNKSMEGTGEACRAKRNALNDYCNIRGFNFKGTTHSINRIIACVFGVDRRRVSAYATALRKALVNKVEAADLVNYFVNAGGLEEVRTTTGSKSLSQKDKAALANKSIQTERLGTLRHEKLGQSLDAAKIGSNVILVGTWNPDGSIDIRATVESQSALNAALASYYSARKEERAKAEVEAEQKLLQDAQNKTVKSLLEKVAA
jgi:hypothetical protein